MERELKDLTPEELEKFEQELKRIKQQKHDEKFKTFLNKPWRYTWNSNDNYSGWNDTELYLFPTGVKENGDIRGLQISNDQHWPEIKFTYDMDVTTESLTDYGDEISLEEFYSRMSKVLLRIMGLAKLPPASQVFPQQQRP